MGVTIFYRGSIEDPERIEDLEDRVLDLALEMGSDAQIWRTVADDDPKRIVRGIIVTLEPGQESTSLLFSPEGWLIPLMVIEDAERGLLTEPPWCWVKTQFGSLEGHVALVALLDAVKKQFLPNLEVRDEGGYWETRDFDALARNFRVVQAAIKGLAQGLKQHGLSSEAAEDPNILATRIERVAKLVHETMSRPPEHPPVTFDGSAFNLFDDHDFGTEAEWEAAYKENRRKQERLHRAIEERLARGEEHDKAFENAMRDEGMIDLPGERSIADADEEFDAGAIKSEPFETPEFAADDFDVVDGNSWEKESFDAFLNADEDDEDAGDSKRGRHPLQQRALDLMLRLHDLTKGCERHINPLDVLRRGAGEMMGGLAQALSPRLKAKRDGWDLMQLRRALRGAAFAHGALFPLRVEKIISDDAFDELREAIKQMEADIQVELARIRTERGPSE